MSTTQTLHPEKLGKQDAERDYNEKVVPTVRVRLYRLAVNAAVV